MKRIAVLGAGSWGTALAVHAARAGFETALWARRADLADAVARERENRDYLPGIALPESVRVTASLGEALEQCDVAVLAVPSHGIRELLARAKPFLPASAALLCAAKGIEEDTLMRPSEIGADALGPGTGARWAALSGPTFAVEVARGEPAVAAVASADGALAVRLRDALASPSFRLYSTTDLVGVELGGAVKNVIAIAAGIVRGLGFGYNTQAALVTRGLVEMARLAVARGAGLQTLMGAAGIGDLLLTCTGPLSRNLQVGERLGRGLSLDEAVRETRMVAEGVRTARAVHRLAARDGVDMPISEEVYRVLYEGKAPRRALEDLMAREPKEEGVRFP
jgi:glycerol-3-phosphate dehydrogenase (NAD(P)+)